MVLVKFFYLFILGKIGQQNVFYDILERKIALLDSKNKKFKVARYSFPGPIPPKFEHKLRRHKQSFEKIATTVVLDKDENLL